MEENDDLPCQFDVVVVGTGMVESIVAASCSRVGKNVLHLDSNLYYGDYWATVGLEALQDFSKRYGLSENAPQPEIGCSLDSSDLVKYPTSPHNVITDLAYKWFIPSSKQELLKEETNEKTENIQPKDDEIVEKTEDSLSPNEIDDSDNQESTTDEGNVTAKESSDITDDNEKNEKVPEKPNIIDWSVQQLKEQSRKFNIDLAPKVIYSTGAMVELLLKSCVYRYTEFQSVSQILAHVKNSIGTTAKLEKVPCTKSDVFSNRSVSVVDKRILMKVLNYCLNFDESTPEYDELKDQLFLDYLNRERVPDHLIQYIFYSIAMATGRTLFTDAVKRIQCFLKNVGRYGNSPFLWPLYGSGELLQAFCRLSAVYGGIYYLGRGAEAIVVSKETKACVGIISNSKHIKANHVVTSAYFCPREFIAESKITRYISRTILFTDRPLYLGDKEAISILHFPANDDAALSPIVLLELPSITGTCPKGLYVVHISYQQSKEDWSEVRALIDELFNKKHCQTDEPSHTDTLSEKLMQNLKNEQLKEWLSQESQVDGGDVSADKPNILYAFHYVLKDSSSFTFSLNKPDNLHLCHGPDSSIDFDRAVKQAKEMFTSMFPTEEFLEPTPDPNDITLSDLIGEENDSTKEQNKNETELINNPNESSDGGKEDKSNELTEAIINSTPLEQLNENLEALNEQLSTTNINEN